MKNTIFPGDPVSFIRKDGTEANECFYVRCHHADKTPETTMVEVLDTEKGHRGVKRVFLSSLQKRGVEK